MIAIIPIQEQELSGMTIQTVDARELHAFLEVKGHFKDWIARRIKDYGFQDGRDFCSFLSESSGGRPSREYALTLNMAKELSMVERNDKGKQARRYFIECERKAKELAARDASKLSTLEILQLAMNAEKERLVMQSELAAAQPKLEVLTRIEAAPATLTFTQAAKVLDVKIAELSRLMAENAWIYRQNSSWVAYQKHIQNGHLVYKEARYYDENIGMAVVKPYCHITHKGLVKLADLLNVANLLQTEAVE